MSSANWPFQRLIRSCRITAKHIPLPFHTPIEGSDATLSTEVIQPRQPEVRPNRSHRKVRFVPATRRTFPPPFRGVLHRAVTIYPKTAVRVSNFLLPCTLPAGSVVLMSIR